MKNSNERLNRLFNKYIEGTLSPIETDEFSGYVEDPAYKEEIQDLLAALYKEQQAELMSDKRQMRVLKNVLGGAYDLAPAVPVRRIWPRIVAAASVVLALSVGLIFYLRDKTKENNTIAYHNDVAPGHQGATLTLANGRKIRLTAAANGQLATQAGVEITKTQNGQLVYEIKKKESQPDQINTLSTGNGETYQVKLPDGTRVWLNSASSLTYAASLDQTGKRQVKLTGEGYFEVAKDKLHPFVVQTANQEVEVLGTHFNINSYQDEPAIATTLLEGSVKVTAGNRSQVIKPGEQLINNGTDMKVAQANTDNITDWKDGDFNLNDLDFRVAMRKIARWYDVEVIYDATVPQHIETGGWISRDKKLSVILRSIESLGSVHFKVEGKKLYVSK
jgi:hypothetical protein